MKIKIEFTQEEKNIITRMALMESNKKEIIDQDKKYAGNFGTVEYDCASNEINVELKTGFINASCNYFVTIYNMLKAMISTAKMYTDAWLENVVEVKEEPKKEEAEVKEENVSVSYFEEMVAEAASKNVAVSNERFEAEVAKASNEEKHDFFDKKK